MDKAEVNQEDKNPREITDKKNYRHKKRFDKDKKSNHQSHGSTQVFRGDHEQLKGHVYTYDANARPNQYDKTTEKIRDWAKKELAFSMDIWRSIKNLQEPDCKTWKPKFPEDPKDDEAKSEYTEELKEYMIRKRTYVNNKAKVFTVVLGQCSESMKAKLEGQEDWESIYDAHNLVELLKGVKAWMLNQQGARSPVMATYSSLAAIFRLKQARHEDLVEYRKRYTAATQVLDHVGVKLGGALQKLANGILKEYDGVERSTASTDQIQRSEEKALNRLLAVAFLSSADSNRYHEVTTNLDNEYLKGSDQYPEDITSAYYMLANWTKAVQTNATPFNDGVSFAQGSEPGDSKNKDTQDKKKGDRDRSNDKCHRCGKLGHHAWQREKCGDIVGEAAALNAMADYEDQKQGYVSNGSDDQEYEVAFCMSDNPNITINDGHLLSQEGGVVDNVRTNSFDKKRAYVIPKGSVGLDSMSSVDVFGEQRLLSNIRTVPHSMRIICNAGAVLVTQMGTFQGYGEVWYHPAAIANILSLSNVRRRFRVTFDSSTGNRFVVHRLDGTNRVFLPTEKGLYASQVHDQNDQVVMLSTVKENKKSFTRREVNRAEQARRLMAVIGRPSEQQLCDILNNRQLINSDISGQDVLNARKIFGPEVGSLKGKTVRRKEPYVNLTARPIPADIMERHREVVICFDIMYINNIAFLVSVSRSIKFCTAEALQNKQAGTLLTGLKRIKMIYAQRGFRVNKAAGDNEFSSLETGLAAIGIVLNTVARDEHVPEIERHIRTLKERCRATYNALPFKRIPSRMIVELVYSMTFWLHAFPARDGVSSSISPRELVSGVAIDANKHCVIPFGAYVQTHEQHDNSMGSRTIGALALRPTGNVQGGHYFYNLQTGRRVVRNRWTEIPMPTDVIERVNRMAERRNTNRLVFGDRENSDVDEVDLEDDNDRGNSDTESSVSSTTSSEADHHVSDFDEHDDRNDVSDVEDETKGDAAENTFEPEDRRVTEVQDGGGAIKADQEIVEQPLEPHEHHVVAKTEDEVIDWDETEVSMREKMVSNEAGTSEIGHEIADQQENGENADIAGVSVDSEMNDRYGPRSHSHNLRKRRKPRYDIALLAQASDDVVAPQFNSSHLSQIDPSLESLLHVVMTQYGVKKGLRMFGQGGENAVQTEMRQLHDRKVMRPKSGPSLSAADRSSALKYLMFLKRKRDGSIKGRGCADGRKQRDYIDKSESSSPTITTEAVFIITTIAAKEGRDVASVDIPGAFMQTDLDGEIIHIKFEGRMAELLAMIDPKLYRQHIIIEKGKPVLYAELCKVLYGMLQASQKFWHQITHDLTGLGYVINPYDWCVANKVVNGKQHTIGWHVDDFIMTHVDPAVNDGLISWLNGKYGKLSPLSVHRGKVHDYLGMSLDFRRPGAVVVTMIDFIKRLLDEAPEEFNGEANTPAAKYLFNVNEECEKLEEQRAIQFHHIVAKALFLCKRARPDFQLVVAFLSTRVKEPDQDDWKKLRRMVQYLRKSCHLCLTLEAEDIHVVKWWVDAAFAVHPDMKSQTGGAMSLGKGVVYGSSVRQKLNTKSSTEAELVGVNDVMPQVLWTRYFLQSQGYEMESTVVYQDNQSAMLLERNGKYSSGKRTRHINVRFFFITDRISSGEVDVQYCPSEQMLGDFFTKPLQGNKFFEFRRKILNLRE